MPYTELTPSHQRQDTSDEPLLLLFPPTTTTTTTTPSSPRNHSHNYNDVDEPHYTSIRRRPPPGRILDRDADYFQSRGRWSGVQLLPRASARRNRSSLSVGDHFHNRRANSSSSSSCCCWRYCSGIALKKIVRRYLPRLWDDWFHTLAYQPTLMLMLILFVTYFFIVVVFGGMYLGVSLWGSERTRQPDGSYVTNNFCAMDITNHMEALYFSLSTMTTIGYGVSDYYFGGCWTPFLLVLGQVCTAITFDACAVGLLFTRLSRGRKRSKTVVVSNQAVVQVVQGTAYFMFRVGELRRFPLMNATVRLFCIRHERIPRTFASPPNTTHAFLRHDDDDDDNNPRRGVIHIPVDTTHFVTRSMKLWHPDETTPMESAHILMSLPQVIVHRMDDKSPLVPPPEWYDANGCRHIFPQNKDNLLDVQSQIQEFWRDRGIEIVVLVEGLDELTGTAVQTRHSYCTAYRNHPGSFGGDNDDGDDEGDVAWNRTFVNCILPYDEEEDDFENHANLNTVCTVDFGRFHDTVPTPRDCLASPYIPC